MSEVHVAKIKTYKVFACLDCPKRFSHARHVGIHHTKVHHARKSNKGSYKFGCPDCRKKFNVLRDLNIHYTKSHPEEKINFRLLRNGCVSSRSTGPSISVKPIITTS